MVSFRTTRRTGPFTRDILTALAVLALVFLNFAHSPGAVAYDAELRPYLLAQNSIACLSDETRDHAPCEVCQLGGTALPEPPVASTGALLFARLADWPQFSGAQPPDRRNRATPARGPPAA